MSNSPIDNLGVSSSAALPENAGQPAQKTANPAFSALLEKLQAQADRLAAESSSLSDAKDLAGAVDTARASLDDALSLSDKLLEAFREARQQDSVHDGERS